MIHKIKAQKGKDFKNLPDKTLATFPTTKYLVSTKYDGNQIFVVKEGRSIRMFTSDWKEFNISLLAIELRELPEDFILVGEFLYQSDGKLGSRAKSAILTTFRTNFSKCWLNGNSELGSQLVVFDYLGLSGDNILTDIRQDDRLTQANYVLRDCYLTQVIVVESMTGEEATKYTKEMVKHGWEGTMLTQAHEHYKLGKRVNYCIKLKDRVTADIECIDTELGEGKYSGLIGSLILRDKVGRVCKVGSGLSDADRAYHEDYYIGKIIEISYEQIIDTYIQPVFIRIRDDK